MESRGETLYAVMGAFVPVATIAVGLRIYSRIKYTYIGVDDILILLALLLLFGFVATTVIAVNYGMGRHIFDVPPENGVVMEKCGFASQVTYPPSMGLVKVSIILFLCRVLPAVHSWKLPLRCFAAFIAVAETAFMFALIFQCSPVHGYWDRAMPGRKCFNQPLFYYIDASFNIFCDLTILLLPTLLFRKLQVPARQKYGVIALCSAGVFTLVSSILRLPYLHNLNQSSDPTWAVVNIVIWSCAEFSSAIIFSSVPTFKPIYVGLRDKYRSHGASSASGSAADGDWRSCDTPPSAVSGREKLPGQNLHVEEYSSESSRTPREVAQH